MTQPTTDAKTVFPGWQQVPAVVISNSLSPVVHTSFGASRRTSTFKAWRLDIAFAYRMNGETLVSARAAPHRVRSTIWYGDGPPSDRLQALQLRFPVGGTATAWVNPQDRTEAYLLDWPSPLHQMLGWPVAAAGAALVGLAGFWRRRP
jgi:hypothetical protein